TGDTTTGDTTGDATETTTPVEINVSAKVNGNTAYLNEISKKNLEALDGSNAITIDLSTSGQGVNAVSMTKSTLGNLIDAGVQEMTIKLPEASVQVDGTALETLRDAASNSVKLSVVTGAAAKRGAGVAQLAALETLDEPTLAAVTASVNGKDVKNFADGNIRVTLPYAGEENAVVSYVDTAGTLTEVTATTDNGTVLFTAANPGVYAITEAEEAQQFEDVPEGEFYYDAVNWAVKNGITNGTSQTTFSPNMVCNRAQVVTFLWRAEGCPVPSTRTTQFTDLDSNEFYYDAVLWAVENGITNGTSPTTFEPNAPVDRAQVVTLLARTLSGKASGQTNPFTDVNPNEYYYDAMLWAVEDGITNGTGPETFEPLAACNRAQIVTFLYRAYVK
ncbi:MAG: S-layer homology domain-containing protein, partial [Oscillospiraceae bacterium]|nr:S-layer homology domain-containing protein [Oscillospiraceae bacterium]